ncbi:MAG: hypothetical protein M3126_02850 [Candidatus Eremiobacteraeota bacterium]|nr:hypothetical protein [Candidatus Eremiobacteraeota bacterium]
MNPPNRGLLLSLGMASFIALVGLGMEAASYNRFWPAVVSVSIYYNVFVTVFLLYPRPAHTPRKTERIFLVLTVLTLGSTALLEIVQIFSRDWWWRRASAEAALGALTVLACYFIVRKSNAGRRGATGES